ncbi:MAG TPA: rhodanese-like domain-containing protein [Terracidiphilus sp.]|jgi:phage shock protein E|nr:rhodanese-like domain-containing protein [Terracidiphilus sp.]
MSTTGFFVALGIAILYFVYKRTGLLPLKEAKEFVKKGALIIDVRTPGEFESGHLSQATNIPLDQIEMNIGNYSKDKGKILLLHCQSGMRSSKAVKRLGAIGYKNAFNIGSYARAFYIVTGKKL